MISMLSYAVRIDSVSIINRALAALTGHWLAVATLLALYYLFAPRW